MKTPKKVIEKISLPLKFATFVMAVLMFAFSLLSAAPNLCTDPTEPGDFCDQDGDGLIRNHKKCPNACEGTLDPDDDCFSDDDSCDVVSSDDDMYTAELLPGAFIFEPYDGREGARDRITIPNSRENYLIGQEDAEMKRPAAVWKSCLYYKPDGGDWIPSDDPGCNGWQLGDPYPTTQPGVDDLIDGPGPWAYPGDDQETWDDLFSTGCPQLAPEIGYVPSFVSTLDNWTWEKFGWRRLVLRDIHLKDISGVEWEIRVQLIGKAGDSNLDVEKFLPTAQTGPIKTKLIRGRVNGRTVSGGSGGRKSCGDDNDTKDTFCQNISGSDKMEGFCLKTPVEMEIACYEDWCNSPP
jgi:hypothetical protein